MKRRSFDPEKFLRNYKRLQKLAKHYSLIYNYSMEWIITYCIATCLAFILHEVVIKIIYLVDINLFYTAKIKDYNQAELWIIGQLYYEPTRFMFTENGKLELMQGLYFTGKFNNVRTFCIVDKTNQYIELRVLKWSCTTKEFIDCVKSITNKEKKED